MDAMAQLPLPAGLGAGTFPAKLWSLANDPRVLSVRWDSEARGLLVDRSLFERELLRPGGAQGPAPNAFRATQFRSFVRQLYRYGFRKVPGRAGAAAPGDAGAWLHYTNPWFRRDRPDLLLRIRRRSAANTQRRAAGPEGRRRPPCGSQQLPRPWPLPDERHGRARFQPLPRERPPLARRPPCGFHLLHRERPGPARREGPSRFQELYGERPLPAERELLRVPPCHFQGFHGEQLLPPRWEGPSSRMQELYGEQPPLLDRELLWMQPCSFQQLHREQQPPASNPPAAPGTSAPHAPAGSAGCAASMASSSAQNAPAQEESPALDLGLEIEKMIREIRNSLPVKAPSAQGNINVAPESPREDPMNRAAAEEVSSGTESCGNSSPEPEEPGSTEGQDRGSVPRPQPEQRTGGSDDSTVKDDEPENQDTEPENQLFRSTKYKQTYVSGMLRFGMIDMTEIQIFTIIMYLLTEPYSPVQTGAGKNRSTIAGTSVLSPFLHIGSVIALAAMIYKKSTVQLFERHLCLYILTFGFVSAKITNQLVAAHMTKSEMYLYDTAFIGPALLFLDQMF
ncbi:hypothetical protein DUI87_33991 [Hirundo rustica rustica]|uniref:HSF-type DNA-binding domain-containing protein n=1 Tax=Hirundo rustica rustica TaxID=333673 RepID=A0A3M0IKS7_HIRRU|nr:hypothetical protein DUI87_33991 [Hirundo rustica rustica]